MSAEESGPASYDWWQEREVERFHTDRPPQSDGDARSPFERDRARIIHSVAFRNLQGKTQIFAPGWADFMRTRVTHSIEVAQIGRALAHRFDIPDSLVEAACLAHDLGHPPFGHTGEQTLDTLMSGLGGFEGNAQSFRIVTRLEQKSRDFDGLDLSRATLLGLLKYPYWPSAGVEKYLYRDDAERYAEWLFEGYSAQLVRGEDFAAEPPQTIVCQLMDWADDIAYSVHDLEDGIVSGMLRPGTWSQPGVIEAVWKNVRNAAVQWGTEGPPPKDAVEKVLDDVAAKLADWEPVIPKDILRDTTRFYIDRFATAGIVERVGSEQSPFDFKLTVPHEILVENQVLKSITAEYVILHDRTTTFLSKGHEILRRLFEHLFKNTEPSKTQFQLFPREMRADLDAVRDDRSRLARAVADYLATMTEGQALSLYGRCFEPTSGSPFGSP